MRRSHGPVREAQPGWHERCSWTHWSWYFSCFLWPMFLSAMISMKSSYVEFSIADCSDVNPKFFDWSRIAMGSSGTAAAIMRVLFGGAGVDAMPAVPACPFEGAGWPAKRFRLAALSACQSSLS